VLNTLLVIADALVTLLNYGHINGCTCVADSWLPECSPYVKPCISRCQATPEALTPLDDIIRISDMNERWGYAEKTMMPS